MASINHPVDIAQYDNTHIVMITAVYEDNTWDSCVHADLYFDSLARFMHLRDHRVHTHMNARRQWSCNPLVTIC